MSKDIWMDNKSGNLNGRDTTYNDPSKIPPKRSHQWFSSAEPDLFTNKKQAVEAPNTRSNSQFSHPHVPQWESGSSYQPAPNQNQFINRLFGSDSARSVDFIESNISFDTGSPSSERKGADENFGLSISHAAEDPGISYSGIRKVKVNQVKDAEIVIQATSEHGYHREINNNISLSHAYDRVNETSFLSTGQGYNGENSISIENPFNNGDNNTLSFGCFQDATDVQLSRPISSYDLFYNQSSVETSEIVKEKQLDSSIANPVVNVPQRPKTKPEAKHTVPKPVVKKEAPNSFPSNVRTLISTGILDGVPIKYVAVSREELQGIIKGSGYLCGCQTCNFSKALNAYEFERHAKSKTKHPNNHIYFENGKTIYQIVQELKNTPESLLFDAIQTVTGSQINQKAFRSWKESYLAATRELQRIYGKEEMNL